MAHFRMRPTYLSTTKEYPPNHVSVLNEINRTKQPPREQSPKRTDYKPVQIDYKLVQKEPVPLEEYHASMEDRDSDLLQNVETIKQGLNNLSLMTGLQVDMKDAKSNETVQILKVAEGTDPDVKGMKKKPKKEVLTVPTTKKKTKVLADA